METKIPGKFYSVLSILCNLRENIIRYFRSKIAIFSSNWINLDKQAFPMQNASQLYKILEFSTRRRLKNWHNNSENFGGIFLRNSAFRSFSARIRSWWSRMKIDHVWLVLNPQTIYLGVCKMLDKNNLIKRLNVNGCDVFYGFLSGPKQIFH